MAAKKNQNNKSYLNQRISRGVNNKALTPSGVEANVQEVTFNEKIISGALHNIIEDIKLEERLDNIVIGINTLSQNISNKSIVDVLNSINDKMIAVLGSLYAERSINERTTASSLLSKIGGISIKLTPFNSIQETLNEISGALHNIVESQQISNNSGGSSTIDYSSVISDNAFEIIRYINEGFQLLNETNKEIHLSLREFSMDAANNNAAIMSHLNNLLGSSSITAKLIFENKNFDKDTLDSFLTLFAKVLNETKSFESALSTLKKIEELNGITISNRMVQDIVNTIMSLSNKKLTDAYENIKNINIKGIVEELKQMNDMSEVNASPYVINSIIDSVKGFSEVASVMKSLKLENNDISKQLSFFKTYIDEFNKLSESAYASKDASKNIINFINGISNISKIEDKDVIAFENIIRRLIKLTGTPNMLTALGLSNTGLLYMLIESISSVSNSVPTNTDSLTMLFDYLIKASRKLNEFETVNPNTIILLNESLSELTNTIKEIESIDVTESHIQTINTVGSILSAINNLNRYVSTKDAMNLMIDTFTMTLAIGSIYSMMSAFPKLKNKAEEFKLSIVSVNNALAQLSNVNDNTKNLSTLKSIISGFSLINVELGLIGVTSPLGILGIWAMTKEISMLSELALKFNEIPELKDAKEKMMSLGIVIAVGSAVLLAGAAAGMYALQNIVSLTSFAVVFTGFVFSVIKAVNIASKGIDQNIDKLSDITMFIAACGGILILGGTILTEYPNLFVGAMMFATSLSLFMLGVISAINFGSRNMDSAKLNANQFMDLIVLSGGILAAGSLFMMIPNMFENAMMFVGVLTAFMWATLGTYTFITTKIGNAIDSAEKFGILIGISAASLMLGGLLLYTEPWLIGTTLLFGAYLAAFVWGTTLLFNMAGGLMQQAADGARDFAILVGIASLCLIVGGTVIEDNPNLLWSIPLFGALLSAFVAGVTFAFNRAGGSIGEGLKNADQFAILVGLSAGILLVGGMFMQIDGMALSSLQFAGIFALFMGSTLAIYTLASKHIKNAKNVAIEFGVITAISAATLMIGGMFMQDESNALGALAFTSLMLMYIGGFTVMMMLLSSIDNKKLMIGTLALAGISLISLGVAYVIKQFVDVTKEIDNYWDIVTTIGIAIGAIVAFGALAGAIGLLATSGVGLVVMGAGEALLAGLVGIVYMTAKAVSAVAKSSHDLNNMPDLNAERIVSIISDYMSVVDELGSLANPLVMVKVKAAQISTKAIASTMTNIGEGVKYIADLKTPIYEGTKISGYLKLKSEDFTAAADNVKTIITVLGNAILDTYKANPDIFSAGGFGDFLRMDTPFSRVVKSSRNLGSMISEIAEGVRDMSRLHIPVYEGTKVVSYRELNKDDFKNAAENIKKIISITGASIISLYNSKIIDANGNPVAEAKEMFGWTLFGDNPFAMTVKSVSTMGEMISKISAGVKDYAQLRMPIYDKQGNVVGYEEMKPEHFSKAAENIKTVITILGQSIIDTYTGNEALFTDSSQWHTDADKTPFGMVAKSLSGVGTLVLDSAKAVQEIDKINIPNTDALKQKVTNIITALSSGIMSIYSGDNKKWFEDNSIFHTNPDKTPFGMVRNSLSGVSAIIEEAITAIKKVNEVNISEDDLKIDDKTNNLYKKISVIVRSIPTAIIDLAKDESYKDYFDDDDSYEFFEHINKSYSFIGKIIEHIVNTYTNINNALSKFNEDTTVNSINANITLMVNSLPSLFIDEQDNLKTYDNKKLESIKESFDEYESTISTIVSIFSNIHNNVERMKKDNAKASPIDAVDANLTKMINSLNNSLQLFEQTEMFALSSSFVESIKEYNEGTKSLVSIFKMSDIDTNRYDNMIKGISGINSHIAKVPNLDSFREETKLVKDYVQTINSLDVYKVDRFGALIDSLSELASKMGTLDRFTEELSNKLAAILNRLADELTNSSNVLNTADEMQKRRAVELNKTIEHIKELMGTPLTVNVNHGDTETTVSTVSDNYGGESSQNNNTAGGGNTTNNYDNSTTNNYNNSGRGYSLSELEKTITNSINKSRLGLGASNRRGGVSNE